MGKRSLYYPNTKYTAYGTIVHVTGGLTKKPLRGLDEAAVVQVCLKKVLVTDCFIV